MKQFDRVRVQREWIRDAVARQAPPRVDATDDPELPERLPIARPVQVFLAIGIDGQGPLTSAVELADAARTNSLTTEQAVEKVALTAIIRGAAGGFVTGVGGAWAMPAALPANVVEFYLQAARMASTIAALRGYDLDDSEVRKAVLQTLIRPQTESGLANAVSATRGGALTRRLLHLLPSGALLVANKGIGFRVLYAISDRLFGRFSRAVPFIFGGVVASRDGWMMWRIAERARVAFPTAEPVEPGH